MSPSVSYVDQIVGEDQHDVAFGSFSGMPKAAEVDVVHLHRLTALGGSRAAGIKRIAAAGALALMLKRNRIALVRTLQGADARGGAGRYAKVANRILNQVTTEFVVVDDSTADAIPKPATTIPYGHYRERFVGYPRSERTPGRLLYMSPFRGDKAESIVSAFLARQAHEVSLRFVGGATDERSAAISRLAEAAPDAISTRIERVSDGTLVAEITGADLVIVPRAAELEDIHQIFLALSLDRPVLVPDNPLTRSIAASVGEEWVHRYEKPLSTARLDEVFRSLRDNPPTGEPNWEGRDTETTTAAYADVYRRAAQKVSRG
jgi:beta-1,4-mannosyltransferase